MSTTIQGTFIDPVLGSSQAETVTPLVMVGFSSTGKSKSITHDVIGRADPDVTMQPGGYRTGTLQFVFTSESDSYICERLHRFASAPLTLTDTDLSTVAMTYVVPAGGNVGRALDDTRTVWVVSVDFQEVAA